jgi:plastocyanin
MVEGRPTPEFYFEPVGLLIQPGDSVRFVAVSPHHTATAYHEQHVKSHRVPDGVEPFSSPVVPVGEVWTYTFSVPGTYDLWCGPHEHYGMAMRIVVGEPGGPAEEPVTNFGPDGALALAGLVLNDPALASQRDRRARQRQLVRPRPGLEGAARAAVGTSRHDRSGVDASARWGPRARAVAAKLRCRTLRTRRRADAILSR